MFIREAIEEFCSNTVPSRATVPSQTPWNLNQCKYVYTITPPLPALYLWSRYLLVFMILRISLTTSVSIYLWNMNNDNSVINNSQPYFVWEFHIHVKKHEVVTSPNPTLTSDPEHARWDTFPLLHKLIFFLPRPTILSPSLPIPFTSILWGQIGATLKPCQENKRSKIPLC